LRLAGFSTILSKTVLEVPDPVPRIVDGEEQRRRIRDAARQVFAARGVEGTGLAHVADAAGMGRSSLYHYYPDRDALLRDLARDLLRDEQALFTAILRRGGSPRARIERLVEALARTFEAWASVGRMAFDLRPLDGRRFRSFFRAVRAELAAVIGEGQALGEIDPGLDPGFASAALIGAVDGLLLQKLVEPELFADVEAFAAALVATVRKVLAP
jgi:AcrR family transcriptional regulator